MRVTVTELAAGADRDDPMSAWDGAPLFSWPAYTRHLGACEVITAESKGNVVARWTVPVIGAGGCKTIARSSFLSPYFPILFRRDDGLTVKAEQRRRLAMRAIIEDIQRRYEGMVLPLHPDLMDMVPFQQAHMQLELRFTYELPLADLDGLRRGFDPKIRNHLRSAQHLDITVHSTLDSFDLDAALFYEDAHEREAWRSLVDGMLASGHGSTIVARAGGVPVGGLFLVYDHRAGYNLLSYFDRQSGCRGIPSALIWAAAQAAAERGLERLDLEGSVLSRIERFYQQFGGIRRPYYQVHWHRDPNARGPITYEYETEQSACD